MQVQKNPGPIIAFLETLISSPALPLYPDTGINAADHNFVKYKDGRLHDNRQIFGI
jgi:hypothetical protein